MLLTEPENIIKRVRNLSARLKASSTVANLAYEIIRAENLIEYSTHPMNIFVPNLDENGPPIGEKVARNREAITNVA